MQELQDHALSNIALGSLILSSAYDNAADVYHIIFVPCNIIKASNSSYFSSIVAANFVQFSDKIFELSTLNSSTKIIIGHRWFLSFLSYNATMRLIIILSCLLPVILFSGCLSPEQLSENTQTTTPVTTTSSTANIFLDSAWIHYRTLTTTHSGIVIAHLSPWLTDLDTMITQLGGKTYTVQWTQALKQQWLPGEMVTFLQIPRYRDSHIVLISTIRGEKRFFQIPQEMYGTEKQKLQSYITQQAYDNSSIVIEISGESLNKTVAQATRYDDLMHQLRNRIIDALLDRRYQQFTVLPYNNDTLQGNFAIIASQATDGFQLQRNPSQSDDLDAWLSQQIGQYRTAPFGSGSSALWEKFVPAGFVLNEQEVASRASVDLFRDESDLVRHDYERISYRKRRNNDESARKETIKQWFQQRWFVRVINIGETISLPTLWIRTQWVQSAIVQWILTNRSLDITKRETTPGRDSVYFAASIDGVEGTLPWLSARELSFTNTSDHPIILVTNFNGVTWWIEHVFTLGKKSDKGYASFIKNYEWSPGVDCYDRERNRKLFSQCYE